MTGKRTRGVSARRILPRIGVGLLLALAGCAAGPDYHPPVTPVPDAWQNAAAGDVQGPVPLIEQWWTVFDDSELDSLLARARRANLDLAAAVGRIAEARAVHRIAGGDYLPQIAGTGGFQRAQPAGGSPANNWEFGLGVSWELDLFGRVRRTREATGAALDASVEDYRDVMVTLLADVAATYVDIRTLQLRLDFAAANALSQRETVDIAMAREGAGLVPLQDVTRARANLANTEAVIPQLRTALTAALNRLAILLGEQPGALDEEILATNHLPSPATAVAASLPAELLRRRPDVRRSERRLAAQTARVGVATSALYPSFSLTGALNLTSTDFAGLGDSGHTGWSLVPGMKWNLFAGGKLRGQIQVEEARTAQALAQYEKTVLQALAQVENALVALRQEEIRRDLLRTAVEASQQSVALVETQYVEGLTDFQNYLDAQRVLFTQQDQYAVSRGLVVDDLIAVNRALGGGWSLADPVPTTIVEPNGQTQEEEVTR